MFSILSKKVVEGYYIGLYGDWCDWRGTCVGCIVHTEALEVMAKVEVKYVVLIILG